MIEPRLFVCSGTSIVPSADPDAPQRRRIDLDSIGHKANINIRFENVAKVFLRHLSPRLVDFLEIAAYVFSADCATRRGTEWTDEDSTEPWARDFAFVIPVRDTEFWSSGEVTCLITEVLSFLSDDKYSFTFVPLERERSYQQQYLEFGELGEWPFYSPERVLMFSGGLDSLAGAVETVCGGDRAVLVSHRSVTTLDSRQQRLFREFRKQFPARSIHIPVWINKDQKLGREHTQRTRSFLYAAVGTVVAQSMQAGGIRFYENGIVSLNLPVADEALRARASRTTHPIALQLLKSLCTAVAQRNFAVDNPYLYKTKADVVGVLAAQKVPHLITHTCSCAHSMFKSGTQWHCGTCSQCIDRRFAIIATGLQAYDLEVDYASDVFVGPRKDGPEKNMAVDYTRHGIELGRRAESELAGLFNFELSRAVRYEPKRSEAAERIVSMHKRHGEVVTRVLREKIAEHAAELVDGTLESTSLLALVIGKNHLERQDQLLAKAQVTSSVMPISAEEIIASVFARIGQPALKRAKPPQSPSKRDTVIFAAILLELKGPSYCAFLNDHKIKPKWSDSGSATTYPTSYEMGDRWRKKVQDEKTRASARMSRYADSELANAFITYLPEEFDKVSPLLHSRDSRRASKNPTSTKPHKR